MFWFIALIVVFGPAILWLVLLIAFARFGPKNITYIDKILHRWFKPFR
ncbi:MAG: hypothetical protein WC327_04035 [Candidatus Cloacimonadia bacterium]